MTKPAHRRERGNRGNSAGPDKAGPVPTSYIYDGDGNRVEKCTEGTTPGTCSSGATGTLYWRGTSPDPQAETDLSGNVLENYIFFNGQRIARREPTKAVHFYFSDHLGSHGVVVNSTGTTFEQDIDYYPYGGQENDYSPNVAQHYKFTGKERDSESGLDMFGARYYGSSLGRFMTPDKPFADQHAVSPQSWNLYSYTRNNPLSSIDPDGQAVVALTQLAQQRIQSTVPKDVRSQVTFDKSGTLNRASVDAIKSSDSNVKLLQQAVDAKPTIEVTTAPSVQGGQPSGPDGIVGVPFTYQSVADQQAQVKAAGGDPSGITIPTVYDGYTQTAAQSPSGNVRVTVADGSGATATEPSADLAAATAHELYGHAVPLVNGQPYEHDNGGPVDKSIKKIEDHTKELNQNSQ